MSSCYPNKKASINPISTLNICLEVHYKIRAWFVFPFSIDLTKCAILPVNLKCLRTCTRYNYSVFAKLIIGRLHTSLSAGLSCSIESFISAYCFLHSSRKVAKVLEITEHKTGQEKLFIAMGIACVHEHALWHTTCRLLQCGCWTLLEKLACACWLHGQ